MLAQLLDILQRVLSKDDELFCLFCLRNECTFAKLEADAIFDVILPIGGRHALRFTKKPTIELKDEGSRCQLRRFRKGPLF